MPVKMLVWGKKNSHQFPFFYLEEMNRVTQTKYTDMKQITSNISKVSNINMLDAVSSP